jgi:hypothetical protein
MISIDQEFPLKIEVSFKKLFDSYRSQMNSGNELMLERFEKILKVEEEYPILTKGISKEAELKKYMPQIDLILDDLFNPMLTKNEIKGVSFPFNESFFKTTQRYKDILSDAGDDYSLELMNFSDREFFIMGCSMILSFYYGYKIDFRRPFYYKIPDKNGIFRSYRVMYNADFIEIEKTERSKDITQEDVDRLLENFENINVWKELFPPNSWKFKGFVIVNLFDVTMDVSVSDFKTNLLKDENDKANSYNEFTTIFRSLFNINNIEIGFSNYNEEDGTFEKETYNSYLLNGLSSQLSSEALCCHSHNILFNENELFNITNVDKYYKKHPDNPLLKKLKSQNIQSAIFASIIDNDKVLGILEIVSPDKNSLNTINANKLEEIMPFFIDFIVRKKEKMDNDLELIIQDECTSIHSSVHWKFKNEAKRYYNELKEGKKPNFKEIVFEEVYPLFGQIDIKGSSNARNLATKKDLILQLEFVIKKIEKINKVYHLLIFEQLIFSIEEYLNELDEQLLVDSEQRVTQFLDNEILPLFKHLSSKNDELEQIIGDHCTLEGTKSGFTYEHRKQYDDSVMLINRNMASVIDSHQADAQAMYPHYFERFKTDGVEHNLYIGRSITKHNTFNKVYLYNLRLWQLQVMCEMENSFYSLKDELPVPLDVSSMILVFNSPLSLRFRMDEKRFDVDGTYNARYEVVKKRVDKSYIKGTEERVTQPGKISIIYTHSEDEKEYLKYISFLQSKKKLLDDVEILEIEDLQGVTGLKAIRVSVLYSKKKNIAGTYYTYEDLMNEIE